MTHRKERIFTSALSLFLSLLMLLAPLATVFLYSTEAMAAENEPLKKRATYYTAEEVAILRENAKGYYASTKTAYETAASKYLNYSYEDLWAIIPGQNIPRSYAVNQPKGCLNCGKAIDAYGNYPYTFNYDSDPWKLTCPNCKMKFPTNDFASYYKSGLDSTGRFQPSLADPKYLKNTLYPEKGEKWGVDSGRGYVHTNGEKYFFVAYYNHWANWYDACQKPITNLMYAYLYTGEQKYADRAIIFLNRFADLYPEYNILNQKWGDGFRHSGGDYGKIVGSIWETGVITDFLYAYDILFPAFETLSSEALDFIKSKSQGKINTYKDVMVNIENGIYKQILPEVKKGNIKGNNGMHQRVLCLAAMVIDDPKLTKEWLEFAFKPSTNIMTGLNISATFVNDVDRDGMGNEASPHYNILWLGAYITIADMLKGYTINGTDISYDLYENVKFKKMFTAMLNILLGESFTPNIGDADNTAAHVNYTNASYTLSAYLAYKEPKFAQMLYWLYKGNTSSIVLGPTEKNPTEIGKEIEAIVAEHGELTFESQNLTGYGFTSLMNINRATETGNTEVKNTAYGVKDIAVIGLGSLNTVTKTDDAIKFNPASEKDTLSLGIFLNNPRAVYDTVLTVNGIAGAGKYNVYVDGVLLQNNVSMPEKGAGEKIYFRRTLEYTTGYHVISLEPAEGKVGPIEIAGISILKTASSTGKSDTNKETSLYLYYGRNGGHGHADTLNMGIFAYNMDLMPDLGYPEYCDGTPNQVQWVSNTVSHNTVIVNDARMGGQNISEPTHFDTTELVKLISVDAPDVYNATSVYTRTSALIRYDDISSYAIDLFRVSGGNKHTYSFHPAESTGYVSEGLEFVAQTDSSGNYVGSLQGKNIAYGTGSYASGYQWLKNVRKDEDPEDKFSMDWELVDTRNTATAENVHLKLTMLGDYTSVYLTNGVPPTNKPGNPKQLDYLLVNNKGTSAKTDTLFVSVIEPYTNVPYITSSEVVKVTENGKEVTDNDVRALKITFVNGRTDYIVSSLNTARKLNVDGIFDFQGFFGVYSVRDGEVTTYVNDGVIIDKSTAKDKLTATVIDFTKELSEENYVTVKFDEAIDTKDIIGRYIYMDIDRKSVSYKILGAEKSGENYVLDVGDVTFISGYKSQLDTSKGFNYWIKENMKAHVVLSATTETEETLDRLFKSTASPLTAIKLSHDIRIDAKAGDLVGNLFPVSKGITKLYELPDYTYTIIEGTGEAEYFEIRGSSVYLKKDYEESGLKDFTLKICASAGDETYYTDLSIGVLTKSKSKDQTYPALILSETKENTDTTVSAPSVDQDPEKEPAEGEDPEKEPASSPIVLIIVIAVAAVAVIAVVAVVLLKKKKSDK